MTDLHDPNTPPPPSWQGKPKTKSTVARVIYAVIAIALIIVVVKMCTSCTGENRVSADDYNDILKEQEACAQNYLQRDSVIVAMHLEPVAIDAPFAVVVPGGVHLITQDSMTKMLHGGIGVENSETETGTIYVTYSSDHRRDVIAHALSHQLSRVYAQLRNPPMAPTVNGGDHSGRFFASCVDFCPRCPGHPNK